MKYLPAESDSRLFGGNSNWRGPIWFPVNYMMIRSLHEFSLYYGDTYKVECPTGSGQMLTLGRSGPRARPAALEHFPPRSGSRRTAGDLGRQRILSDRSPLARLRAILRVLQRRHGSRCRREPSNRLDRTGRVAAVRVLGTARTILIRRMERAGRSQGRLKQ